MNQIESLISDYDCTKYSDLPKFLKRRVGALKKLQLEHTEVQYQYHKELSELELKYEKLFQPFYDRRTRITNGDYEPTDEDCTLPAHITELELDGDQENDFAADRYKWTEEEEKSLAAQVKGVPGFWLGCLISTYNFNDSIEDHDKPVLKHLKDIQITYAPVDDNLTYTLEFVFEENPYFSNKSLTKTYYLKTKPDEKDPFGYEGYEVYKSVGCEIDWHQGKNVMMKTVTVKQQNKNDGRTREKKKEVERDSFFYFFKPPEMPENEDDLDEELGAVMQVDYELGEVIRNSIIPKACLYYTGYMMEEEGDDDDDDLGDDDDDEDDDSLEDDSDDDSDMEENEQAPKAAK